MLFASTATQAAIAALEDGRLSEEERARRVRFAERYRIYIDDFDDVIREAVRRVFSDPEKVKRIGDHGDATMNPFRQVVDETYSYPGARRRFLVSTPDGERDDPVYAQAFEEAGGPLAMAEASIAIGGFNDCLIGCFPAREDAQGRPLGPPKLRVFFPHEVSVVEDEDDPGQPVEVSYQRTRPDGSEVVVHWTATEHWIEERDGRRWARRPARGASTEENPYGRLPFIAVHAGLRTDSFWDPVSGQRLVEFTKQYGRDWAALNFLQQQQSYLQLKIEGNPGDDWEVKTLGPGTVLLVPNNCKADVLNLQAQIQPALEKLKIQLTMAMRSYGIDAERYLQNPGQVPVSGIARMIERMDLLERRKKLRPFLLRAERDLAELFRWAWNWNQREPRISEEARFEAEILEEEIILSPTERLEYRERLLKVFAAEDAKGWGDPVEQFAEYKGIPVEKARELLEARRASAAQNPVPRKPEILGYHIETGMVSRNQVLELLGLPKVDDPDADLTLPELRAKYPERYGATTTAAG